MRIGLIKSNLFLKHQPPGQHPENPHRLEAISEKLRSTKLTTKLKRLELREATDNELLSIHSEAVLNKIRQSEAQPSTAIDADTYTCEHSHHVARIAAGSGLIALEQLLSDKLDSAMILARPPGHHACSDRSMGFCLFNNVALVARQAIEKHGLDRVAIVDWDVHHGNGTEQIFYNEPKVLYISSHEYPNYPGTGTPKDLGGPEALGKNLNFPLPTGLAEEETLNLYFQVIIPLLEKYSPQLLLVSAGFDAHVNDPLGRLNITTEGFGRLTAAMESLKLSCGDLKTLYLLEGGYNPSALADSVAQTLTVLLRDKLRRPEQQDLCPFVHHLLRSFPTEAQTMWDWSQYSEVE